MEDHKEKSKNESKLRKGTASLHTEASPEMVTEIGAKIALLALQQDQMGELAIAKQNRAFDSFKMNLSEKDEKIENLQQKLKNLERENSHLKKELECKVQEINELKRKVHALESDKKKLQEEVTKLKTNIQEHEKEIKSLQGQVESLQGDRESLRTKIEYLEEEHKIQMNALRTDTKERMDDFSKDLEESNRDRANLRKRLNQMELQRNTYTSGLLEEDMALDNMARIYFGEMCRQLQNKIYEKVLPKESFTKMATYKVKNIEKDIKDTVIVKTEERKKEAATKWEKLKKRIGWDDEYIETIELLVQDRNATAHPQINKEVLYRLLNETKDSLPESGYLSVEKLKILIGMWEQLIPSKSLGRAHSEGLA